MGNKVLVLEKGHRVKGLHKSSQKRHGIRLGKKNYSRRWKEYVDSIKTGS